MDAVKFLKERMRMCESSYDRETQCAGCLAYDPKGDRNVCKVLMRNDIKAKTETDMIVAVDIVEKWSKDHPRKTRLQDFKEKYPNGTFEKDSEIPHVCCDDLGYCFCKSSNGGGPEGDCKKCWNEPVE